MKLTSFLLKAPNASALTDDRCPSFLGFGGSGNSSISSADSFDEGKSALAF
jgi:hypothetical protein